MIKRKVIIFGDVNGLGKFFHSGYVREYDPVAIMAYDAKLLYLTPKGNYPKIDVVEPEDVPDFVYRLIDGVVLISETHRQEHIEYLLKRGVAARKIIPWEEYGKVEILSAKQSVVFIEGLEFHLRNVGDQNFFAQIRQMLQNQKRFFAFDPRSYPNLLTNHYNSAMGRPLQWNNLQTWTEKMQWLKLFDATPLKSHLTDKYLVRNYVAERIGNEYLVALYGSWEHFDDIDFDFMPEKFVLRCNHAPNFSIVVDKNSLDIRNLREKFTAMMQVDYGAQFTFELHYSAIKRRIIAEKLIEGNAAEYKFLCFNGKPIYCLHDDIYYDMNWDTADFETPAHTRKPKNFKLMKKLTEKLCGDFAFVRVDFKELDGDIYFDALEFTPAAGMLRFKSDVADKTLGELLTLPNIPARLPTYNPADYTIMNLKYEFKLHFAHPERITFPKVEPCTGRVIASLTSWTKRINTAHLAVQTILAQSRQPDLTVMYLADSEFPSREKDLPKELLALVSDKFEIHWVERNIKSYKKLIPALKEFPDDIIVTFDDDLYYHREIIERLLAGYEKYPQCIQCHVGDAHYFDTTASSDVIATFSDDLHLNAIFGVSYDYPTHLSAFNGSRGILYPPHSLYKDVSNEDKFMKLAPTNDDIWFPLMAALNGYRIHAIDNGINNPNFVLQTQEEGLTTGVEFNEFHTKLIKEYDNIFTAYPQLREILWQEWLNAKPDK